MIHRYGEEWAEQGQSLVRFTMVLLILLVISTGVLDLGRLYCSYMAITDAAEEGAAYAALHPDDVDGTVARVQAAAGGVVEIDRDWVEVYAPLGMPRTIAVAVTYEFSMVTPFVDAMLPDGALILRAASIESLSRR